ncbi:hypothetical protein Golob_005680 [Gossypium lobatum]|uniref:Gag-pol polyprotein n=1 Tax=Gossypium lobatum TaxID=34289 RepID=A0A7J8MTZ2_9ROSI|nr:hypothetical protein [Gossypium lobatum]
MDERAWRFILTSREPFTTNVSGVKTPKPETTWTTEERKMENKKNQNPSMQSLMVWALKSSSVSPSALLLIETTYEGTNTVKQSKLQMLTKKFKTIRMLDDERANGIDTIRIDELIGSLQTFEMTLEETKKRKGKIEKNIALQVASSIATKGKTIIEDSHNN